MVLRGIPNPKDNDCDDEQQLAHCSVSEAWSFFRGGYSRTRKYRQIEAAGIRRPTPPSHRSRTACIVEDRVEATLGDLGMPGNKRTGEAVAPEAAHANHPSAREPRSSGFSDAVARAAALAPPPDRLDHAEDDLRTRDAGLETDLSDARPAVHIVRDDTQKAVEELPVSADIAKHLEIELAKRAKDLAEALEAARASRAETVRLATEVKRLTSRVASLKSSFSYRVSFPIRLIENAIAALRKRPLRENIQKMRGRGATAVVQDAPPTVQFEDGTSPAPSVEPPAADEPLAQGHATEVLGTVVQDAAPIVQAEDDCAPASSAEPTAADEPPAQGDASEPLDTVVQDASPTIQAEDYCAPASSVEPTVADEPPAQGHATEPLDTAAPDAAPTIQAEDTTAPAASVEATAADEPPTQRHATAPLDTAAPDAAPTIQAENTTPPAPSVEITAADELSAQRHARDVLTADARRELVEFLASSERLVLPQIDAPIVSIVVVLWNAAHLTLRCIRALIEHADVPYELVLVDNASSDDTSRLLSRLDNAVVLVNATNEGFVRGCNRGVAASRGRVVLLLNSDAFVRRGAISSALTTLESVGNVGSVGARLLRPDGKLQEAGSIVWSDAGTHGYGRGLDPEAGEVMFLRDVDYSSGAFLMTPRSLWDRLGGFEEAYSPAYYEDVDYCLRLHDIGYRSIYDPRVVVDHFEFGSEAVAGQAIQTLLRNRKLFRRRHSDALKASHLPPSEGNILAARTRVLPGQRRLLVIDSEVPAASQGDSNPRAREMVIAAAAEGWVITFFPLHRPHVDWEVARASLPWEVEIVAGRGAPALASFLEERRGYYDAILVRRPDNMALVRAVLRDRPHVFHGARLVYDAEALLAVREAVTAEVECAPFSEAETEAGFAGEIALAEGADAIVCVTESEAEAFRARQAAPVHVLEMFAVDEAPAFASAVVALHEDKGAWESIQKAGRDRIATHHSATAFRRVIRSVLDQDP